MSCTSYHLLVGYSGRGLISFLGLMSCRYQREREVIAQYRDRGKAHVMVLSSIGGGMCMSGTGRGGGYVMSMQRLIAGLCMYGSVRDEDYVRSCHLTFILSVIIM